jgi:hypothetical protein
MGIGMLLWLVFAVAIVWLVARGLTELDRRLPDGWRGRSNAAIDQRSGR